MKFSPSVLSFLGRATTRLLALLVAVTPLFAGPVAAPQAAAPTTAPTTADGAGAKPGERDEQETPRGALTDYLIACRDGDYAKAAEYLDLREVPAAERASAGPRLALRLKVVLDQKLWFDLGTVDDSPEGALDDGLPPERDRVGSIAIARGDVDILLERVPREDGVQVWKFAAATVARIPGLYAEVGFGPLIDVLPRALFDVHFLEIALWQWIGLMLLVVLSFLAAWILALIVVRIVRPLTAKTETDVDDRLLDMMTGPLRLLATVGCFAVAMGTLRLAVPAREILREVEKVLVIVGVAWLILRVIDLFAAVTRERLLRSGRTGATHLVPLGARALKITVSALTLLAALDNFGFDVTTVIAGLGVGGLAVALAAQKTLENVFGGISVLVDQPVLPGEFCKFGDQVGTVEDIGIRSTRIRTLDRTLISVPNAVFSNLTLENFAKRDRIRLIVTLGLRYETSPDQLRFTLAELRKMLIAHPKVLPDPQRARFVGFGASSLDVEIFCYIETTDFNEFLAVREDVYLRVVDIVQAAGTGFAFPSTTTYFARDGGLDDEKTRAAEAAVALWRKEGALMFPEFSREEIERLDGTLDYPPKGSSVAVKS